MVLWMFNVLLETSIYLSMDSTYLLLKWSVCLEFYSISFLSHLKLVQDKLYLLRWDFQLGQLVKPGANLFHVISGLLII